HERDQGLPASDDPCVVTGGEHRASLVEIRGSCIFKRCGFHRAARFWFRSEMSADCDRPTAAIATITEENARHRVALGPLSALAHTVCFLWRARQQASSEQAARQLQATVPKGRPTRMRGRRGTSFQDN